MNRSRVPERDGKKKIIKREAELSGVGIFYFTFSLISFLVFKRFSVGIQAWSQRWLPADKR